MSNEQYWSRFADTFEQQIKYVAGSENIKEVIQTLESLDLTGRILETGCGTGMYSKTIAEKAKHLTSCDYSEEMLTVASRNLSDLPNTTTTKEDCMNLSFSDNTFDSVILINILHIIQDPETTLKEAKRVLKPEGRLIIISFTTYGMSFINKIKMIYRYLKTYGKPPASSRTLTLISAENLIKNQGFNIISSKLIGQNSKAVAIVATK